MKSAPGEITLSTWTPGLLGSAAAGLRGRTDSDGEEGNGSAENPDPGATGRDVQASGQTDGQQGSGKASSLCHFMILVHHPQCRDMT